MIGYLEPHDRPETTALAEGLEVVPRLRAQHGTLELEEMDVDAVVRRAPGARPRRRARAHERPGMRNEKRWQDIDDVLDAGIDVISTVNVQHLESLNDAIFELTEIRVRETFPDRILDEADEVVLVDLSPEELQERLRAGKVYPKERAAVALENFFQARQARGAPRARAARGGRGRRGPAYVALARAAEPRRPSPSGCSHSSSRNRSRSASCVAPGARLSGSAPTSTRCGFGRPAGRRPRRRRRSSPPCAVWRCILGVHFLEEEGDDLVAAVRRVAAQRGSTYVFVGTPDESRRREIFGGSLLSRMVRELPGIDIRVIANRADRDRLTTSDRRRHRTRRARSRAGRSSRSQAAAAAARPRAGARRILVPFTGGTLDPTVLDAAIRHRSRRERHARPGLPPARPASLRRGLAADARRSPSRCRSSRPSSTPRSAPASPSTRASRRAARPTHALQRLWDDEHFDRILAPAPTGRSGGFTSKDVTWILAHAPTETLVLKPDPNGAQQAA